MSFIEGTGETFSRQYPFRWLSRKESAYQCLPMHWLFDWGSIPGLGRVPGEGNGNPLQYSCPGNPMWTLSSLEKILMVGKLKAEGEESDRRWDHQLNGRELGQTPGDSERQGGLGCCSPHRVTKRHIRLSDWTSPPGGSVVKNPPANAGDVASISGLERYPGEGNGNPL